MIKTNHLCEPNIKGVIKMGRGKSYNHKRKNNDNKPKIAQVNNVKEKDSKQ
jgi:hypothetical protein